MKKTMQITAIAMMLMLATACKEKTDPKPNTESNNNNMSSMSMSSAEKMAKGSGYVTAIDVSNGKITLNHGPIAELSWPAMNMAFAAKSEMLSGIVVGDRVTFEFMWNGTSGQLSSIKKQ